MDVLFKERVKVTIISVLLIVVGVLFCALPEKSLDVLETVIAIGLIIIGAILIIGFCCAPDYYRGTELLFVGALAAALGIVVIFAPWVLILGIGIYAAVWGVLKIGESIKRREFGDPKWWIDFVLGLSVFVLSTLLIIFRCTSLATDIIMIYLGVSLILDGITNLVFVYILKRTVSKIRKKVSPYIQTENYENDKNDGTSDFTDYSVK